MKGCLVQWSQLFLLLWKCLRFSHQLTCTSDVMNYYMYSSLHGIDLSCQTSYLTCIPFYFLVLIDKVGPPPFFLPNVLKLKGKVGVLRRNWARPPPPPFMLRWTRHLTTIVCGKLYHFMVWFAKLYHFMV